MGNSIESIQYLNDYAEFLLANCVEKLELELKDEVCLNKKTFVEEMLRQLLDRKYFNAVEWKRSGLKKAIVDLIPSYTNDVTTAIEVVKELDEILAGSYRVTNWLDEMKVLFEYLPQLFWSTDSDWNGIEFNDNWYAYTNKLESDCIGSYWMEAIHADDLLRLKTVRDRESFLEEVFSFEYRLLRHDASYRWFLLKIIPVIKENNQLCYIWVNTDIHDLVEALDKVERINKDLDSFIYIASHDLKSPVSNIEGLIHIIEDMLSETLEKDEILRSVLGMVVECIGRFQVTIADLADVSKTQRNLSEDIEEVNFASVVNEVKKEIKDEILDANAKILIELDAVSKFRFSRQDLKSVMLNLISNAVKYKSPERNPEVKISAKRVDGQVVIMVKDNGLGIPKDKKDYVFNMFKRLHNHVGGSGIGLYIVKRIIDNNQGKIELESEVGKGSTFKVYIPEEE